MTMATTETTSLHEFFKRFPGAEDARIWMAKVDLTAKWIRSVALTPENL